ncbi:T9SS-dependent choice-of-anchor J family protein [Aureibacter tunicatorum]|uniref:Endonuclease/exonuclease/phosphatase family metal-dependent hydrolase n=1 Tax=Aureibacter tunicatorum TaxID=866807 RepID=A0AAE3XP92_9BACT|nr:choice-of-anchor J domain-containing protein [Aureibacter tunicatorum]MDR6238759.1 endonuclease/exonuclease/phosphatase family metal-dependent hydrolase [Aureibacter tunicatorum]BDD05310.1 hypothetical protein AUTU_27930 [Aureibacter tunicatorum]
MKKHFHSILFIAFAVVSFTVQAQTTVLVNEGFHSGLGGMDQYSFSGSAKWGTTSYGQPAPSAKMSGYSSRSRKNEDWLISPKLDLSNFSNVELSFDEAINYENNVANNCKVMISTNYSGSGNPSNANWIQVNMSARANGNSWTFISTGVLDLSNFTGNSNVHIAFKYTSSNSSAGTWEIDNIYITANTQVQNAAPTISSVGTTPEGIITNTDAVYINANIIDDKSVSSAKVSWGYSSSQLANSIVMNDLGNDIYKSSTSIPPQSSGTKIYYQVSATDNDRSTTSSTVKSFSIESEYLDIVTYNIEWLGKPSKAGLSISRDSQITKAAEDIINIDAEVYALQEIVVDPVNGDALTDLINKLNALDNANTWSGDYNTYFSYWWNPNYNSFPAQRQAYVYKTSKASNVSFTTLLTSEISSGDSRFGSGRLPFMMEADIMINGITQRIHLVNLHLKCCTGSANRRKSSMQTLVNELNNNYRNANVIVLGDLNVADQGGAYGEISTWGIYDDKDSDGANDYEHAAGSVQDLSYYDIDHILISNELTSEYAATPSNLKNQELNTSVSDHKPIKTSLTFQNTGSRTKNTSIEFKDNENSAENSLRIYPNPVENGIIYLDGIDSGKTIIVNIFDEQGRLVISNEVNESNSKISVEELPSGIYFAEISNQIEAIKLVIK